MSPQWEATPFEWEDIKDMIRLLDGDGTRARCIIKCPEDDPVLALCERHGFGAVMDSVARQWFRIDPNGAFVVGPCAVIARAAWAGMEAPNDSTDNPRAGAPAAPRSR